VIVRDIDETNNSTEIIVRAISDRKLEVIPES